MTMALQNTTTKAIARPLSTLVPLIKKAMAEEQKTAMEMRREVGSLLLEAQDRMKEDGTYFKKGGLGTGKSGPYSGEWGRWLEKNFTLSSKTAENYMRLAAALPRNGSSARTMGDVMADRATRRIPVPGGKSRAAKLIDYLTAGGKERIAEFSKADERERKQEAIEQGAVDRLKNEIIDVGFRECSKRYHPDRPGGSEKVFQILNKAKKELKEAV